MILIKVEIDSKYWFHFQRSQKLHLFPQNNRYLFTFQFELSLSHALYNIHTNTRKYAILYNKQTENIKKMIVFDQKSVKV